MILVEDDVDVAGDFFVLRIVVLLRHLIIMEEDCLGSGHDNCVSGWRRCRINRDMVIRRECIIHDSCQSLLPIFFILYYAIHPS